MQTVELMTLPAGRFLNNVPKGAAISWGRQHIENLGPYMDVFQASDPKELKTIVDEEITKLRTPHNKGGLLIEKTITDAIKNSFLLYYWSSPSYKGDLIDLKCYLWKEGWGFYFKSEAHSNPVKIIHTIKTLAENFNNVFIRPPLEIPAEPGFCFENAFFKGEPTKDSNEHIALHLRFPAYPGVFIRLTTDCVGEPYWDSLLTRHAKNKGNLKLVFGTRTLRAQERTVGPYHGEELIQRVRDGIGKVNYHFMWEYQGLADDAKSPALLLEMVTGHGTLFSQSKLSRQEAYALWEIVLESLRYRDPVPKASEP